LKIPLLLGQPEFKKEGIYLKKEFTQAQLVELNYLFTATLMKLDFYKKYEFNNLRLFEDLRERIYDSEINKKEEERKLKELHRLILKSNDFIEIDDTLGTKTTYFTKNTNSELEESDIDDDDDYDDYDDEIDPVPF